MATATLKKAFTAAAEDVKTLPKRPKNDQLLELYALYKQATEGDASGSRPGVFDLTGRAKYDAWVRKKGTGTEAAMKAYIDCVAALRKPG
jgi:acyl-CoA-binding protein